MPYEPTLPVDTDWDLGIGDAMAVWFSQSLKSGEVRLIDYHETSGEGFPQLAAVLKQKGYAYGTHWAPHDIAVGDAPRRSILRMDARWLAPAHLRGKAGGAEIELAVQPRRRLIGDEL